MTCQSHPNYSQEMFIYFILFLNYLSKESFSITIFSKGTLPLDKNSVALQFYFSVINENQASCRVGTRFKKCSSVEKDQDLDYMFLYGSRVQNIMPGGDATFVFVYPSVFHHDKRGICYIEVNCKCGPRTKRKILEIAFDTSIATLKKKSREFKRYIGQNNIRNCDYIDEDGLDDCSPVDCEAKYMDEKPFYDVNMNRCVRAVTCIGTVKNDLPTIAYLPTVNLCRDLEHPVQIQDIYAINNGMTVVTDIPRIKSDLSAEIESNCSTISQKISFLDDIIRGKMNPSPKGVKVDYSTAYETTILSILGYILCLCLSIFSLVCCMQTIKSLYCKYQKGDFENIRSNIKQNYMSLKTCKDFHQFSSTENWKKFGTPDTKTNDNVRDGLLRDVIYTGIPMELRSSAIDVCDRMEKQVRWKKRYRVAQTGTPFDYNYDEDGTISSASSADSLRANTSEDENME